MSTLTEMSREMVSYLGEIKKNYAPDYMVELYADAAQIAGSISDLIGAMKKGDITANKAKNRLLERLSSSIEKYYGDGNDYSNGLSHVYEYVDTNTIDQLKIKEQEEEKIQSYPSDKSLSKYYEHIFESISLSGIYSSY